MVVVAFPRERACKPFMPSFEGKPVRVGAYFLRRIDADDITRNTEYGEHVYCIIFHEYAHSLVSDALPSAPLCVRRGERANTTVAL